MKPPPAPTPPREDPGDSRWMARALDLAQRGVGLASPNPTVGCVLVADGRVVGEGLHEYDQRDHAEIVALRQAGGAARGATAYVTLEPCSHQGRTGPCADALIAAGVARVVAATRDPNPAVGGRGIERLQSAGVATTVGVLEEEARRLTEGFARSIRAGVPFVTLKAALSLDGRISPPPERRAHGAPFWLTGEAARAEVQQMRHASDALLTGIGTVLADDPLLTDRSGLPRRRPLLRVILDSALRLPVDSQLVRTAQESGLLVFHTRGTEEQERALVERGVKVERLSGGGPVPLAAVLERLHQLEITTLLIEAGTAINTAALAQNLVDKLSLFYAPLLLGSGLPLLAGEAASPPLQRLSLRRFGSDVLLEGYLRDPWE